MAMGIVSDKEFDSEYKKTGSITPTTFNKTPTNVTIEDLPQRGRGNGNVQVPDGLRKIIGEESAINGRQSGVELGKMFGISPSSVSAYGNGARSTTTYNETADQGHVNNSKLRVIRRAHSRLGLALKFITPEKLADAKPRDLAGIAKDMSAVIKNMEPEVKNENDKANAPQFVFYAPQFRDERKFETIVAKE